MSHHAVDVVKEIVKHTVIPLSDPTPLNKNTNDRAPDGTVYYTGYTPFGDQPL